MNHLSNILGKLLILVIIIVASHYHILAGILAVLIFISLNETNVIEGMESKPKPKPKQKIAMTNKQPKPKQKIAMTNMDDSDSDEKPSKETLIQNFKGKYCSDGKLMKNGTEVEINQQQITDNFPDITFLSDMCNPCDDDCKYDIISSSERLTVEDNLKSVDSNSSPVIDRASVTAKSQ